MGSESTDGPWWFHNRQRKVRLNQTEIEAFVGRLSRDLAPGLELAVLVAGDAAVREANRRFRGKAASTDVLSFPDDEPGRLGDILISAVRAERQAADHGHSVDDEIKTLILHGFLHLLGHDHDTDSGEMWAEEQRRRRRYRLAPGLIERAQPC